mmetsp:Transcript_15899/g.13889  ORF Transcript_15899/g.13889 Transcript_15899/m.13889 type:complete len:149 (+) Transcript_15899:111-557(+)
MRLRFSKAIIFQIKLHLANQESLIRHKNSTQFLKKLEKELEDEEEEANLEDDQSIAVMTSNDGYPNTRHSKSKNIKKPTEEVKHSQNLYKSVKQITKSSPPTRGYPKYEITIDIKEEKLRDKDKTRDYNKRNNFYSMYAQIPEGKDKD